MRLVLATAAAACMISLAGGAAWAMLVPPKASAEGASAAPIALAAHKAVISRGRIAKKGCHKKIGAGLRTPC